MHRQILIVIGFLLFSASMLAEDSLPVIEIKADRTMIYPQRMELTGEETLMDILQMMPDLMIVGYEDVISDYSLRIDNSPMNGDTRLILSQMKAKDIAKIQVCDNTGVAKGSIGMGKVLDINMVMPESLEGFVEGQVSFGKDTEGNGTVNALYGSRHTDLYANASYRYRGGDNEYLTLHMTNRFDDRNKLLTYFTQQYLGSSSGASRKVMGRARYFHTFNDLGTELLIVGSYQYASDPLFSNKLPLYTVELNTPLVTKRLSMMLGFEGDFLMTRQKHTDRSWDVFNNDIYLQFTYSLPKWRFTIGNRVMFYNYRLMEKDVSQKYSDTRDNANACVVYVPDNRNQIQLGYYRKYYNPSYIVLFMDDNAILDGVTGSAASLDEEWLKIQGQLDERAINQVKLAYAYSRQKLTLKAEASHFVIEDSENLTELATSVYWKKDWLSLKGGANLYATKSAGYAAFRLAPTAYLPHEWQIGMQVIYYTKNTPRYEATGVPVYGCLSVNKQLGTRWNLGIDWHDMFDAFCSDALINRHAVNLKLQYRF